MNSRNDPARKALPFPAWPQADQCAWHLAIDPGSALRDAGRGAYWRPATRRRYVWAWGRWLTWLTTDGEGDGVATLAERIADDRVSRFVAHLQSQCLSSRSIAAIVEALHNTLWALCPDADSGALRQWKNHLIRIARPLKPTAHRTWPVDRVYAAALTAMRLPPPPTARRPLRDSIRYRDALLVAMLCAVPLRLRNIASLALGRHLRRQEDGFRLVIPAAETKRQQAVEAVLPASLAPFLDHYLDHHRPRLAGGQRSDALWLTQDGAPFTTRTFAARITRATRRLGYPMSAHDFRRSAATSIAEQAPELARSIGYILGHRSLRTAEVFYNKAQMISAGRRYTDVIGARRRALSAAADDES